MEDKTSQQKTESDPSKKAIFLKRAKGMPFEEFKKFCIQQFKEAGLIKEKPQPSPDDLDLKARNLCAKGLTECLEKQGLTVDPTSGEPEQAKIVKPSRRNK